MTAGVLIAMVAAGYGIAQANGSEDSAMVAGEPKGDAYCTQYPDMCPQNPTAPVPVNPDWLQRFEDADRSDEAAVDEAAAWTEEDAARLEAAIEVMACADSVPGATTQEEADAVHQARTAAHLQPILDEFWAPRVRETMAQDWLAGVAIGANAGRHAPVDCRLHDYRTEDLRWDDGGIIAYVRYQTLDRFLDPTAGAYSGEDGWELPNRPLEFGYMLELERDESGRIMLLSQNVYTDLALGDSGI
jgi:hypothetical protein